MDYLYLHGFASSPQSSKAQFLKDRFASVGKSLHILDLNQGDFTHLTLSRQIEQGVDWVMARGSVTIIGSSLGGLTATWMTQDPRVQRKVHGLMLLAPAFQFLAQWLPRLGAETISHWQLTGSLPIYHYGYQQQRPLAYDFMTDAQQYNEQCLDISVPTLILHGCQDEVIDIQVSREYARSRPWVELRELESDHSLASVYPELWSAIAAFMKEKNL
ncbi:MAG: YqiA/YcfP family alpha/beta fold hydrolase [Cyanobacteria bacterium J06638_28]